jgi:predicted nucleic acid-binding Zn ribbon protein
MIPTYHYTCPHCLEEIEIPRSPRTGISDNLPEHCDHCGGTFTDDQLGEMLTAYDEWLDRGTEGIE